MPDPVTPAAPPSAAAPPVLAPDAPSDAQIENLERALSEARTRRDDRAVRAASTAPRN